MMVNGTDASGVASNAGTTPATEETKEKGWFGKAWDWLVDEGISGANSILKQGVELGKNYNDLRDAWSDESDTASIAVASASSSSSSSSLSSVLPLVGVGAGLAFLISKII